MLSDNEERAKMADLYETHRYTCLHVAFAILKRQELAEDAVHEAFLSVIKNKDKMLGLACSDFRREIVTIVRNKCIDVIRKDKRMSDKSIDDLELESDEDPLDVTIISREEFQNLSEFLLRIDDISRTVLIMKYVQGLSYKEIGNILNMTPKHVETRIYRAKAKVLKLIERNGGMFE
jgi:RNA polymerase sigma-70 factor (ECF subfamily)